MPRVLADTGPLYASTDIDDSLHSRARSDLNRLGRKRFDVLISYPTLLEAHRLVLQRLGRKSAASWLDDVLRSGTMVNPTMEDYLEAVMKVAAYPDQSITLFDAVLAVLASRLKLQVWTYDHHFDVMGSKVWR